jgi:uncharacterized protein (TIGR02246 family)
METKDWPPSPHHPMRTLLYLTACLTFSTLLVAEGHASSPPGSSTDDAAVRAVIQKYMDARDQRDATALAALFTSDVDQLVSSGEWRKGRDAVVKGTLASSQASAGKRTITVESVRIPSPEVALADGRYELAGANGQTRKMWTTILLRRDPDGWHITAIRNMLPAPPAPAK